MTATIDEAGLRRLFAEVKTWSRWGGDDERGTLNYLTPDSRRRGVQAINTGEAVSCGLPVDTTPSVVNPSPAHVHVLIAGDVAPAEGFGQARDFIALAPHGPVVTHLDALCHVFHDGLMYNGRPASLMRSTGAQANAVTVAEDGIVGRGILLDLPAADGVEFLDPDEPVTVAQIEAAEQRAGVEVGEGDVLLLRVGRHARRRALGDGAERPDGRITMAGLHPECLSWLRDRRIALLGSDAAHDVLPTPYAVRVPVHVGALVYLGLHLLDNADFDELAIACAARQAWDFLFCLAPLRIPGGTASPVNPIAVL